jgi:hypothetical protein
VNILSSLPFSDAETVLDTPAGHLPLYSFQIALTVSLLLKDKSSRPFPAILDTGLNQPFALTEGHLERWLGLRVAQLPVWGHTVFEGQKIPVREAKIAIHSNVPGKTAIRGGKSYVLKNSETVIVFPPGPYPRLPILGLRSLVASNLRLVIDGQRKLVHLQQGGLLSWLGIKS